MFLALSGRQSVMAVARNKYSIQWIVFTLVLILCPLVVCGDSCRISYLRIFEFCSLAEDSDRLALDSVADCKYACLAKQGSCAAYQWDTETNTCRLQTTLNITKSSSRDNVGVMMETDSNVACTNDTYCAPDYTCHGINTDCGWLRSSCVAADCSAIQTADPGSESGVYDILAATQQIHKVWCDMDTDGGGWTVFLRRLDGSEDFYQPFAAYQQGFGNVSGEYWLGLDALHALTSSKKYKFRADMSDWAGLSVYALYASMVVGVGTNYTLTVGDFAGGLGGYALNHVNNSRFSAMDVDQDGGNTHCAQRHYGGFWYNTCQITNPTGKYYNGGVYSSSVNDGIQWKTWSEHRDAFYSLKTIELKLRP